VLQSELPYTSRAKKVLEYAMASARDLTHNHVGTEHLLLGLLMEEKGIAAQILNSFLVTVANARELVHEELGRRGAEGEARSERQRERPAGANSGVRTEQTGVDESAWWFLEVDASSGTPIYEQIIARIEEAVATGQLEVGERLPPVRDLAAELDVAPGTVARAYSTLESRGVLETRGARGTRVAPRTESSAKSDEPGMKSDALEGLLRPVVVAAYHLGARADELKEALERAMRDIFRRDGGSRA
jgi:DNA-binding transcriptional regulator YhcF (GntR family)